MKVSGIAGLGVVVMLGLSSGRAFAQDEDMAKPSPPAPAPAADQGAPAATAPPAKAEPEAPAAHVVWKQPAPGATASTAATSSDAEQAQAPAGLTSRRLGACQGDEVSFLHTVQLAHVLAGGRPTVEGCLQGSNGNYTLTDSAGTTYQLAGDTSKLTEHVGHEVEIKGSTSPSSSASAGASSQPTLTVDSVKHVSKTCKAMTK